MSLQLACLKPFIFADGKFHLPLHPNDKFSAHELIFVHYNELLLIIKILCFISEKDTDLTEEEQIRLLQEYQKECQEKTLKCKDNLLSESFEDNHYSSAVESRNGGVDPSLLKETESNKNLQNKNPIEISEEKDYLAVLKTREKKDMVIISEGNSCQTSSCSGDKGGS